MSRRAFLFALACGLVIGVVDVASAQIPIPNEPHTRLTLGEDRAQLVVYPNADCDPECATTRVVCSDLGRIDISVYNFTQSAVIEWMSLTEGPFVGATAGLVFTIATDDVTTPFIVWTLSMNDFDGTWVAETIADRRGHRTWFEAFATATEVFIATPAQAIVWPNRPEDRANRAAFVEACLAM